MMSVQDVVRASLRCMKRNSPICIPGWKNRRILTLYHILPRSRSNKIFKWIIH
jgi:short-subunit dehydrogenase